MQLDHAILLLTTSHKGLYQYPHYYDRRGPMCMAHLPSLTALGHTGHLAFSEPLRAFALAVPSAWNNFSLVGFPASAFILQVSAQISPPWRGLP